MNVHYSLRLAFDPSELLLRQKIRPDPWQRRLLLAPTQRLLLNCSRQSGKSTTVAALALHTAYFMPGSLTLLLSPSLRQSGELFRKVATAHTAAGRMVKSVHNSQTRLEFVNRSRIVCLPGREETVRSFSGVALIVIDEAARVSDDLYRSVRPMLAVSGGRLVCLSTPFGQRGFFWREWQEGGPTWQRVRISWRDCPRITEEFIEQERRSLGDSWVAQEYQTSFESLEGLVYPDFASNCVVDVAPTGLTATVGGIDFGYRNPFAALWGAVDGDGVLWILGEHYERERTVHDHASHLPSGINWFADPAGAHEIEVLRRLDHRVRKGTNDVRAGIAAVHARLQTGRLRVVRSACPNLLAEAALYRYPTRAGGAETETPVDEHNHALAALRYLVAHLDANFLRTYRRDTTDAPAQPPRPHRFGLDHHELWQSI